MEHEELVVATLGPLKELPNGLDGIALGRSYRHVVALGEPGGLELGPLPLLLDVEDLVEGVLGELVGQDLAGAEPHGLLGVRLVEVAARVAPEAVYGAVVLLVLGQQRLGEVAVVERLAVLPVGVVVDQGPGGIVEVPRAEGGAGVPDGAAEDAKHYLLL